MKSNPRYRKHRGPTHKQQKREIKKVLYAEHVKAMRPYFGEVFKASSGYDLRNPEKWTGAQKAKITKYWRVIAPQISRSHQPRRFKRKDHLREAIAYTQQEKFLPGQTAALFSAEKTERLTIRFRKRKPLKVHRQGVRVDKVYFDLANFMADPEDEVKQALAELGPGVARYKLMMGPHESRGSFTAGDVSAAVMYLLGKYSDEDEYDPMDDRSQHYTNWLLGIVAYRGRKAADMISADRTRREAEIQARKEGRNVIRAEGRRKATRRIRLRMK